ncbi:hypothetical protein COLO4_02865 [Corchorus olitorius]|uniref:HAT C-terminal dimerisation domain-containing protein n=1 Tax=Corchorus olitorius TaxID=93759 RepID=A0A1R3L038_9ROSI|nr:hypothetical protein COLO4_02865 [Corchorus olitorius]
MARDVLGIPITTVASESTFSMGARVITKWRSSLRTTNTEEKNCSKIKTFIVTSS